MKVNRFDLELNLHVNTWKLQRIVQETLFEGNTSALK